MRHFTGYHNFERMEQEAEELETEEGGKKEDVNEEEAASEEEEYPYGFLTRKKPDRFLGNVIWGIQGQGKPREYYLYRWFIAEKVETIDGERFAACLRGLNGIDFPNGFYLNDEPWFPEFRAVNSNFSLGLQEIAPKFLHEICTLVKRAGFPLPPDCDGRYADVQSFAESEQSTQEDAPATSTTGASPMTPPDTEVEQSPPECRLVMEERIIRDTAITLEVKRIHDFCCQVCGKRLKTPYGPYAEAAHIRPLGSPHCGSDTLENVLCLCPDHHVLFDRLAFSIDSNLRLIGIEGMLRTKPEHPISEAHVRHHRERFRTLPR